jgi:predicted phosphodiesterase
MHYYHSVMKLAILADIHANADALYAVLSAAQKEQVDGLLVAGDLVGYYFEPKRVLRLLQEWNKPIYIVKGNHEEILLAAINSNELLAEISLKYGPGISIALSELSGDDLEWIASLQHPLLVDDFNCSILLSHGSPNDINKYIYPDESISGMLAAMLQLPDVLVMGHAHYPFIKNEQKCVVINPGSVGQPRNREPGAHWALLETNTMTAEHRIEPYNIVELVDQCMRIAPNHLYLRQVLLRT